MTKVTALRTYRVGFCRGKVPGKNETGNGSYICEGVRIMRKCVAIFLLMVLTCTLHTVALGAENELLIEDVTVQEGETVYVTWKLSQPVTADAVAVIFSYDKEVLKPLESSSTWAKEGLIQTFDMVKGTGVWTATQPVRFSSEVCSVAFRVITKEAHFDTKVTCTLRLKNGGKDVGDFTATTWVSTKCEHSFGQWSSNGSFHHGRTCTLCERKQSAPHQWDAGTTVNDPDNVNKRITTFTCEDCGEQKKAFHFVNEEPTHPGETEPEEDISTRPTLPPETRPTTPSENEITKPTNPSNNNNHTQTPTEDDDYDHDHTTPGGNNHDHTHTQPNTDNISKNIWIFLGLVAVFAVIYVLFQKKKKR